ncbi:MAG: VOC family protein [Pigmentiphaga sp.]
MRVHGIDEITLSAPELERCRQFFIDWGLSLTAQRPDALTFATLNGCQVIVAHTDRTDLPIGMEADPTLREVVWGVPGEAELEYFAQRLQKQPGYRRCGERVSCVDPNGLTISLQVTRKSPVIIECAEFNTWNHRPRVNRRSPAYDRAAPIEVGHVVLFVTDLDATSRFYQEQLGFVVSDRYPGRGVFLRCQANGGHHNLFMLQLPEPRAGLNHIAFTVRDLHEVIGGGMHMSRCGWTSELGPGRHPISSAMFWYVDSPAGALVEYYTDEDELTEGWEPRDFTPGPTVFAEWAIKGGLDGNTRRQIDAGAPSGRFMTDTPNP